MRRRISEAKLRLCSLAPKRATPFLGQVSKAPSGLCERSFGKALKGLPSLTYGRTGGKAPFKGPCPPVLPCTIPGGNRASSHSTAPLCCAPQHRFSVPLRGHRETVQRCPLGFAQRAIPCTEKRSFSVPIAGTPPRRRRALANQHSNSCLTGSNQHSQHLHTAPQGFCPAGEAIIEMLTHGNQTEGGPQGSFPFRKHTNTRNKHTKEHKSIVAQVLGPIINTKMDN